VKIPDVSDPGKAAAANYAAAWLYAQVSMMNHANEERQRNGYANAYGDEAYAYACADAEKMIWPHD
jgi:hypothetical protein